KVIGKGCIQKLCIRIVDQVVEEHSAEPLHGGADRLAMHDAWIDGAADVLNCEIIDNFDVPSPRIDGDMRRVRSVTVGALRICECPLHCDWCSRGKPQLGKLREAERLARLAMDLAVGELHLLCSAVELRGCRC